MRTDDFNYVLPEEMIAQTPLTDRTSSKMMVLDKETGEIVHSRFYHLIEYLNPGDVLVFNDTRVLPARLYGIKDGGSAHIEVLLLKRRNLDEWEVLMKPAKRIKLNGKIIFGNGELTAEVIEELDDGGRIVRFSYEGVFETILEKLGNMPLPPYIKEKLEDKNRYQTVYAKYDGSAAAPTAGLHFTEEYIKRLEEKGIIPCYVTLHVGLGTFRPVSVEDVNNHKMHKEWYRVPKETADILNLAKKEGRRIISVGTTSLRTLEAMAQEQGGIVPCSGETEIFIYPGYEFKVIDGLLTNFHLPKSTLLMLVSALSNREKILNAYEKAKEKGYRFFSFGDCMLLI
ncbi:MAG: tRNA preQ1(34) S-adenosylmethionine ribosyltransferase-isomerase QueA [Clostridia bacterium]|nr:tRNA preQ1(34) S-adenosylmethionine ribosyltransferase-isomerase QueA [Clostridia bacterium]